MTVPAIESVLHQLRSVSSAAEAPGLRGTRVDTSIGQGGFADAMLSTIERINQLQQHSVSQVRAFESGSEDVRLDTVIMDMQKASLAFQMGVQMRNRLVGAYREIMNMQV